ncbi:hypothetical protein GQR42_03630 [Microcystis aeruginosa FD4]|uniref:Uncharacterized protein n=1 Tax=Microcystis aeruginosa FD4 TaxID=2686288 RepID=A0A857D0A0_MICAE|nr:hypothetical protein GQR42_03630 [Microcystis aeruginosa FD4]
MYLSNRTKLTSQLGQTIMHLGTCALIMYLLGERSSPLNCGQNPLL